MLSLIRRPRRLRTTPELRSLVRETRWTVQNLVMPFFVTEKSEQPIDVASMPGVRQLPISVVVSEAEEAWQLGVPAVLLFGIPGKKDELGTQAYSESGVVQRAVRAIKARVPQLLVITDVCLCEFTSHGHCGVVLKEGTNYEIANDATVDLLARTAVSHAEAGADIVAPSDMMDGRVGEIRAALDAAGFSRIPILSYAAKFASAMYGPFRDAGECAPQFGDRRTYQMDAANALEALREVEIDIQEGADMVMVKPGAFYLDLVWRIKEKFGLPTAVYNVSGEYAMVKAAAANGWISEKDVVLEMMTAFRRAGADVIISYWAKDIAQWLKE